MDAHLRLLLRLRMNGATSPRSNLISWRTKGQLYIYFTFNILIGFRLEGMTRYNGVYNEHDIDRGHVQSIDQQRTK